MTAVPVWPARRTFGASIAIIAIMVGNPDPIIRIRQLRKSYGEHLVLKAIDLEISAGQVIGYIGPNGAGKSTTVKILTGLISEYEGEVSVFGMDMREQAMEIKRRMGYVPEQAEIYEVLTPMEYLSFTGRLYGLPAPLIRERALGMMKAFGLGDAGDQRMETFSKGMRQKVLIISALLHNPEILILDEPLSGLDANAVIMVKDIIARLAGEGKTIFYCSHMMDVVEKVSDRIILLRDGAIVADGSFEELRSGSGASLEAVFARLTAREEEGDMAGAFIRAFGQGSGPSS